LPVALLALAGCAEVLDDPALRSLPALQDDTQVEDAAGDDADERQQLLIAWLLSDQDRDGLPNGIELDFGLDPEDPTDGPDIDGDGLFNFEDDDVDGDGIVNATDPDVDGDDVSNNNDEDLDGDGVPNEIDFDMDADGIRDEWDLDFDGDGEEGEGLIEPPDFVAEEFLEEATLTLEGDDDDDDDDADEEDDDGNPFEAYVEYLVYLIDKKGDASARDKLAGLLKQVSSWDKHPIKTDSYEAKLIIDQISDRFDKKSAVDKMVLTSVLKQLASARPGENDDATVAVDVLFRQAMMVENPDKPGGHDELQSRLLVLRKCAVARCWSSAGANPAR